MTDFLLTIDKFSLTLILSTNTCMVTNLTILRYDDMDT